MKTEFRVLVLTDHSSHTKENSLYAIVNQMRRDSRCMSLYISSRGIKENALFFEGMYKDALLGVSVREDIEFDESGRAFKRSLHKLRVEEFDVVLMRLPRPVSDEFLLWIERIFSKAIVINHPRGVLETSNKKYLLNFPGLCPGIRLCRTVEDIKEEIAKYTIVLKPLREYGGRGLLKIDENVVDDGKNEYATERFLEAMQDDFDPEGYVSMRYLKNVYMGDKRILVVGGKILAASLRKPGSNSWLCNVSQGGSSSATKITKEEVEIVRKIGPVLAERGVLIYGIDTLEDDDGKRVLSEINTLSIGGFPQAEEQTGKPIIKMLIDKIFKYADDRTE